jgi:hypothetical protein
MKFLPHLFLIGLTVFSSGCASVSVRKTAFRPDMKTPTTPEKIYVRPFALDGLRVDRKGADLDAFASEFQNAFSNKLAERLTKNIAPARAIGADVPVPRSNTWLVEGSFHRLHQGSRALRAIFGWGLGGTKMECVVRVYDLRQRHRQPFAVIETTGGSNAEPGAIFGGPFGAAPRLVVTSVTSGVSADSRRTARMITAALSEYLAKANAPLPAKPMRAKRLGEVPGITSAPEPNN